MPLGSAKKERIPLDGYAGDFETPQKETWNRIGSLRRHKEPAARIPKDALNSSFVSHRIFDFC
ncbi:hypothetical protein V1478_009908 [Vespula squamosa]|uniref:Uncharacterized protein n=1 Tax=Vespula squamosa TaxID=30214 RepID=A0ABD2AKK2_VESSQ